MRNRSKENYLPSTKNNSTILVVPKQSFATSITDTHSNDHNNPYSTTQIRNKDFNEFKNTKKKSFNDEIEH